MHDLNDLKNSKEFLYRVLFRTLYGYFLGILNLDAKNILKNSPAYQKSIELKIYNNMAKQNDKIQKSLQWLTITKNYMFFVSFCKNDIEMFKTIAIYDCNDVVLR